MVMILQMAEMIKIDIDSITEHFTQKENAEGIHQFYHDGGYIKQYLNNLHIHVNQNGSQSQKIILE